MSTANWHAHVRAARCVARPRCRPNWPRWCNRMSIRWRARRLARRLSFEQDIAADFGVPMDRADLAEVLGNILDNAARHAVKRARIAAAAAPSGPAVTIEDDGPGIAAEAHAEVVERGTGSTSAKAVPVLAWPSCRTCWRPMAGSSRSAFRNNWAA